MGSGRIVGGYAMRQTFTHGGNTSCDDDDVGYVCKRGKEFQKLRWFVVFGDMDM